MSRSASPHVTPYLLYGRRLPVCFGTTVYVTYLDASYEELVRLIIIGLPDMILVMHILEWYAAVNPMISHEEGSGSSPESDILGAFLYGYIAAVLCPPW